MLSANGTTVSRRERGNRTSTVSETDARATPVHRPCRGRCSRACLESDEPMRPGRPSPRPADPAQEHWPRAFHHRALERHGPSSNQAGRRPRQSARARARRFLPLSRTAAAWRRPPGRTGRGPALEAIAHASGEDGQTSRSPTPYGVDHLAQGRTARHFLGRRASGFGRRRRLPLHRQRQGPFPPPSAWLRSPPGPLWRGLTTDKVRRPAPALEDVPRAHVPTATAGPPPPNGAP